MQTLKAIAAIAVLALASVSASPLATSSNKTNTSTTIFLGTEYNPNKCSLQLASLECLSKTKKDLCGQLNGYPLECVNLGRLNGKDKYACQCRANETDVCQRSTAPTTSGAFQFDTCSDEKPCVDSYGHVSSKKELRICAEKLHCVKEINTTATEPAQICHTCRSCIAQNDAADAKLSDKRRFDCTKICPKSILDTIDERNDQNVGIADEVSSEEDSGWGSGSEGSDYEGSAEASGSAGSAKDGSAAVAVVSSSALVATIVFTALSIMLIH